MAKENRPNSLMYNAGLNLWLYSDKSPQTKKKIIAIAKTLEGFNDSNSLSYARALYDKIGETRAAERAYRKRERVDGNQGRTLLQKISVGLGIPSILIGMFFLSAQITGNVVGNLTKNNSTFLGGILFIIGLVGLLLLFRKK